MVTTPESTKGSPKVDIPSRAVVFKSGYRSPLRFLMNVPPLTLWRGRCAPAAERGGNTFQCFQDFCLSAGTGIWP